MDKIYQEITTCQLCGGEIETYLNLGFSPLANGLKRRVEDEEKCSPLEVVKCKNPNCESFQLKHLVNPEALFSNYLYRSSLGLKKHFEQYAHHVTQFLNLKPNSMVYGIGGNNGYLEKSFQELGMTAVNVEPASNIAEESKRNGVYTINAFFDANLQNYFDYHYIDLICANNVLAHCDLKPIIEAVDMFLKRDGYLVMENAYWLNSYQNHDLFQVYAEHYKYLTIKCLKNFFDLYNFDLFRVEYNKIQCGSFRAFIKRKQNTTFQIEDSVNQAIENEEKVGLYDKVSYESWIKEVEEIKIQLIDLLKGIKSQNKSIGLFGVAAKTVLMLKYFNISQYIDFATDDSDLKWKTFIPGTSIEILNKDSFWNKKLDYVIPIYNFFDAIVSVNQDKKVKWVKIIPRIEII